MKKKLFAVFIAICVAISMMSAAAAAGGTASMGLGDKTIDVVASYAPAGTGDPVYSVDITWESMHFTYTESGERVWDPETHTYSAATSGAWDKTEADIVVVNHSDVAVEVEITYTPALDSGITGSIENGTATLDAGALNDPNGAAKMTATLHIGGKPNAGVAASGTTIGTVTVKLS